MPSPYLAKTVEAEFRYDSGAERSDGFDGGVASASAPARGWLTAGPSSPSPADSLDPSHGCGRRLGCEAVDSPIVRIWRRPLKPDKRTLVRPEVT